MAGVDLYGGDAGRIRNQYRSSLGRDASDDEVSGWLSGSYGGGGVDDWIRQISGSHEAQQQPSYTPTPTPPVVGQTPYGPMDTSGYTDQTQAREGLRNLYRNTLGRDASDEEIEKWLTGQFGYGSGIGDYDKYVQAIMSSHEARNYRPALTTPDNGYQNLDWWHQRGVPNIDIFDPLTGQLKPGWQRTARGYERTGGGGTSTTPVGPTGNAPPPGGYQTWLLGLLGNGPSSPQALLALEPELNRYGIRLQKDSDGNVRGRLYMPDGTVVDVVPNGGWGQPWQFISRGAGGGHSGGGPTGPPNQYSDPYTQFLEQLIKSRIGNLGPINDPYRNQLMNAYSQRIAQLQNAAEPNYQALVARLNRRIADLGGPGYTGAEGEVIRTGALDPIERDRTAARRRALDRISAMGYTPDSGIAQQLLQEVDRAFDEMRGSTQTVLTTNDLQRREGRASRADAMQSALYDISEARSQEALDVFGAMDALSSLMRSEDDARNREQVSLAAALSEIGPQRLQLAMQAAGMAGNYAPLSSMLMGLAGLNQQAAMMNTQQRSSWLRGIGSAMYYLSRSGL